MEFFLAFITSFIFCCLIIFYRKLHFRFIFDHDLNSPQKFHTLPTPRIGGIGIFFGFLNGLGALAWTNDKISTEVFYILVASLPVFTSGICEDLLKVIGVKLRLLAGLMSGLVFVMLFEINAVPLDFIYLDKLFLNPWIAVPFLCFSICGLTNAYNIIDGFNGLASMVGMISLLVILFVAIEVGDSLIFSLSLLGIASIGSFFIWNYPRGLIFMGDGGAYFIGFLIAVASILLVIRHEIISPWFALAVNIYPVTETIYSMWRRFFKQRKNMGHPDGLHLHSLIYRRIVSYASITQSETRANSANAKTSQYLWILSSAGTLPVFLTWNSTGLLILQIIVFVNLYIYFYHRLVKFKSQKKQGK